MQTKTDVMAGIGLSGTVGPGVMKMAEVPFYETTWWIGLGAITGLIFLVLAVIEKVITIRKRIKWDGTDRRINQR